MKCDDIKLLLAEYLDGELPSGDAVRVKEHLRTCADCREELQFLKKYMKNIESFPTLKAPDDFLERIHQKIDVPKRGALVKKLFFPLRIKIPMEVAALLALAVTGLLLFNPFKQGVLEYKAEEPSPGIARENDESAGDRKMARREMMPEATKDRQKARVKDSDAAAEKRSAAPGSRDMVTSDLSVTEQLSEEKEKVSRGDQAEVTIYLKQSTPSGAEPSMDDSIAAQKQERADEARNASRKSLDYTKKDKSSSAGAIQSTPSARGQASIDSIASLAQSLEGRIIRKTQDGNQVIVEIPRRNYSQFIKRLRGSWSVQNQYPAELPARASKVQFNINIQD